MLTNQKCNEDNLDLLGTKGVKTFCVKGNISSGSKLSLLFLDLFYFDEVKEFLKRNVKYIYISIICSVAQPKKKSIIPTVLLLTFLFHSK